ncbi:hypothetical protein SBOR_6393 [Sclerotinia borealis F-4128]|uniref:Uncharacterized protein n=1 Tax=Sclerotinia borealis (strain F-4128) TaxID=1432307 RepID=W9C8Z5_SCLBF|nr:hypothetical protein SBOR_6393 [Sclerotinia borealis F-4128]
MLELEGDMEEWKLKGQKKEEPKQEDTYDTLMFPETSPDVNIKKLQRANDSGFGDEVKPKLELKLNLGRPNRNFFIPHNILIISVLPRFGVCPIVAKSSVDPSNFLTPGFLSGVAVDMEQGMETAESYFEDYELLL